MANGWCHSRLTEVFFCFQGHHEGKAAKVFVSRDLPLLFQTKIREYICRTCIQSLHDLYHAKGTHKCTRHNAALVPHPSTFEAHTSLQSGRQMMETQENPQKRRLKKAICFWP
jgi:hypothetical protein